jgi:AcrR family transcriptional regulator
MSQTTKPETNRRGAPHQKRSQKTVDLILATAAELLEESGFENLSTNAICRRAGLTPPALYRYFPNKYAILKELGERLMERQNRILISQDWSMKDLEALQDQMADMLAKTIAVTRQTAAGVWILRALHATPALSDVRLNSHRNVADFLTRQLIQQWPAVDPVHARQSLRLGVEIGYAVIEMVFDEPDLDEAQLIETSADLLTDNLRRLIKA